ncbi:MAG: hypothetical protein V3T30_03050 [Thermodesulfobacteriota bacterium]
MTTGITKRSAKTGALLFLAFTLVFGAEWAEAAEPVVVTLTQTPCTFIEAEVEPREYISTKKNDCVRINRETTGEREFKTLTLKPGKTIFRVTNKNVPYPLGFWVRGKGITRITLPRVSGGGLATGATKDYVIELTPGAYHYSCPLNPTPDYTLIVE